MPALDAHARYEAPVKTACASRVVASCCWLRARVLPNRPPAAQADFYKGKTVTIVVGTRIGGSIGNTALLVSRHMGKYLPGNPTVILRQMPGGAHLNATNHVFNVAGRRWPDHPRRPTRRSPWRSSPR